MQIGGKPRALPLRFSAAVRFQLSEDCVQKCSGFSFPGFCSAPCRVFSCDDDSARSVSCDAAACGFSPAVARAASALLSYHFSFALVFSSCFVIFLVSYTSFVACHAWNHEMGTSGISSPGPGPGLIRRLLCNLPNQPFLVLNKCNDPQDMMNSVRPTSCKATIYGLLPSGWVKIWAFICSKIEAIFIV
jgi:hypothetical protein